MYSRGNSGLSTYSRPEKKPSKNQRVKVWCRVRPTAYFDTEHLELVPDGKVRIKIDQSFEKLTSKLVLKLFRINPIHVHVYTGQLELVKW